MPYNIVFSPAEDIVGVVDAILAKPSDCTKEYISEFADISETQTENALHMAAQLGLIFTNDGTQYCSDSFLARLIVSSRNDDHKAAIMRLVLEQYEPYIKFKLRFQFTGSMDLASKQIKAIYSMSSTYKDIRNTFIDIGTYSRALTNDGANSYKFNQDDVTYIEILELALKFKANDDHALSSQLGEELMDYIDSVKVFQPLSDAYSKIQNFTTDSKSIILYSGNAFEAFLQQLADESHISLVGKNGIGQKADALNSIISKKHRGMINYINQIRNAADHGADSNENGQVWEISDETSQFFPLIVTSIIKDLFAYKKGFLLV